MRYPYLFLLITHSVFFGYGTTPREVHANVSFTIETDSIQLKSYKKITGYHAYKLNPNLDSVKYYSTKFIQLVQKNNTPQYLPDIYTGLAYAYKSRHKLDSARHYAIKGYEIAQDLHLHTQRANAGYTLAIILMDAKKLDEAVKQILINIKFARQHQINYYLFSNYFLLSSLNYTEGYPDPLSSYFAEKAFAYSPDPSLLSAHLKRKEIMAKIENGKPVVRELKDFEGFIKLQKEDRLNYKYQYLVEIASTFLTEGKPQEALSVLLPLAKTKNNDTNDLEFHIYNHITSCYLHLNDLKKAKEWHTKALKGEKRVNINYDYSTVLKNDAIIKEKEGKFIQALKSLKEAQYWKDSLSQKRNELNLLQVSTFESMENLEDEVKIVTDSNILQKAYIEKEQRIKNLMSAVILLLIITTALIAFLFWKIKNHNKKISKQKEILENQTRKLNESNQIKDKLFSLLSHELRSPVAELISILDIKDKKRTPTAYHNYLENIHLKSRNIYNMLDGLLAWSSSQIQFKPSLLKALELKSVVDHLISIEETKIRKKGIVILNQLSKTTVIANENQTNVVIRNILENAIKFTPKDGFIRIFNIDEEEYNGLAIRDTGSGISEKDLKTLLVDVQISQSGTLGEKGTGVGLIICKELMEKQNGKINIYSDGKSGTEVRIVFPKL